MLDAVMAIALGAGQRILEVYAFAEVFVSHKDDGSPLTEADLAAHRHIVAALAQRWPDIPILSEEDAGIPYSVRRQWTRYWLIDPLDGTREFVKRNGQFTVNIALIEHGLPLLGVIHAPVPDLSYGAVAGEGAFRFDDGTRQRIHTRAVTEPASLFVSHSHSNAETDALLDTLPAHSRHSLGSSLKFCQIAEGAADLYPRLGPTSEWDTAAGQAIVEAAGGRVLRLPQLTPLRYNEKDSLENPGFAVIGDPAYGWEALLAKPG